MGRKKARIVLLIRGDSEVGPRRSERRNGREEASPSPNHTRRITTYAQV